MIKPSISTEFSLVKNNNKIIIENNENYKMREDGSTLTRI